MNSISVIVITKNEAHNIAACLESVSWANEIIVFDSGSTDDTVAIAKKYTDKVTVTDDWPGYGPQKQRAFDQAIGDWVLVLDADEVVSAKLQLEIQDTIKNTTHNGFKILRKSFFCGKKINFGDWGNDYITRLFKRDSGKLIARTIHCRIEINGSVATLKHELLHYTMPELEDALETLNVHSTGGAELKYNQGRRANICTAIGHAWWTFIRSYLIKLGFLDGKLGFVLATMSAHGCYYRYLKLWRLNLNKP